MASVAPPSAPAGDRIGAAVRWWLGEIGDALPDAFRRRRAARPRAEIRIGPGGVTIDRVAGGIGERFHEERPIEQLDSAGWEELAGVVAGTRPSIVLSVPDVYWTEIRLPAAARTRLRASVALQLPQIAPLSASSLVWAAEPLDGDGKTIRVLVAMARAARVEELRGLFHANGLPAPAIAAEAGAERIELDAGESAAGPEERLDRRAWLAAGLLLASIPFTTWAAAEMLARQTDSRIEELREALAPRLVAERREARTEEVRKALRTVFDRPSATDSLESLALALPESDHARAAARGPDGRLRVVVDTGDPDALQAKFGEHPVLAGLEAADMTPAPAGGRLQMSFRSAGR